MDLNSPHAAQHAERIDTDHAHLERFRKRQKLAEARNAFLASELKNRFQKANPDFNVGAEGIEKIFEYLTGNDSVRALPKHLETVADELNAKFGALLKEEYGYTTPLEMWPFQQDLALLDGVDFRPKVEQN